MSAYRWVTDTRAVGADLPVSDLLSVRLSILSATLLWARGHP